MTTVTQAEWEALVAERDKLREARDAARRATVTQADRIEELQAERDRLRELLEVCELRLLVSEGDARYIDENVRVAHAVREALAEPTRSDQ